MLKKLAVDMGWKESSKEYKYELKRIHLQAKGEEASAGVEGVKVKMKWPPFKGWVKGSTGTFRDRDAAKVGLLCKLHAGRWVNDKSCPNSDAEQGRKTTRHVNKVAVRGAHTSLGWSTSTATARSGASTPPSGCLRTLMMRMRRRRRSTRRRRSEAHRTTRRRRLRRPARRRTRRLRHQRPPRASASARGGGASSEQRRPRAARRRNVLPRRCILGRAPVHSAVHSRCILGSGMYIQPRGWYIPSAFLDCLEYT